MAKKINVKDFLLRRGEVLVMGVSGFFLAVMLIWGASKWTSAMDPDKEAQKLKSSAQAVYTKISDKNVNAAELPPDLVPPKWIITPYTFKQVKVPEFTQSKNPLFDPTAQPSTKRENPAVLTIGEYQVDLTRSAMLGYDIIFDAAGEPLIAVLTTKIEGKYDKAKVEKAKDELKIAATKSQKVKAVLRERQKQRQKQNQNQPMGFPMGGPDAGGPMPGMGRYGMMGGSPYGMMGGGEYDQSAQRVEKAVKYIPLAEIDKAVQNGNLPALTVIPQRLVTVHAVVPYRRQLEEIRRALRLPNPPATAKEDALAQADALARQWGPWYDGFEVQRRVSKIMPDGQLLVIQDWPEIPKDPKDTSGNYKFEEIYIDKIDTKKIADHFDEGYIPYFLKPELMLSMPLPQLAKDLNVKYPEIKLKDITDNIEKLKKANQKEIPASELAKQIQGLKTREDLYRPKTADSLGNLGYGENANMYGPTLGSMGMGMGGVPMPPRPKGPPVGGGAAGMGSPIFPEGYGPQGTTPVVNEVDNYLLRFVDCDVKPGYTYQYRIRLRMINPNYKQDALVANPEYAKENYKILYSKWLELQTPITVPAESFLYAHDVKAYREKIDEQYPAGRDATTESKALNSLLQVKENQAVVQMATWMEQVRAGDGAKREPVGAWVVAEMPVGRGEYVGRKQFIKLPLWSSESQQYVLREVSDKVVKGKYQPKGWLVDFSTKSVLVDFEGGKVKSRFNVRFDSQGNLIQGSRNLEEDVATEMLMVRPDGKLVVRSSAIDDADPNRKSIVTEWMRWVDDVSKRKTTDGMMGEPNPFDPKGSPPGP